MSSRDEVLERVRRNQPAPRPLPDIPTFDAGLATSIETFKASLTRMKPRLEHMESELASIEFFEKLPWADRTRVNFANVRGVQFIQPLFEFSGAWRNNFRTCARP